MLIRVTSGTIMKIAGWKPDPDTGKYPSYVMAQHGLWLQWFRRAQIEKTKNKS